MTVKTNPHSLQAPKLENLGVFAKWDDAREYLTDADPVLARLFSFEPQPPKRLFGVFEGLIRVIIAQQISNKVAFALWQKVWALTQNHLSLFTALSRSSLEDLRAIGLSQTKAETIVRVVERFESGQWSEEKLAAMDDAALVSELTSMKGIGPWTATSVLIFGLGRPDVCPLDDFGIKTALCRHYFSLQTPQNVMRKPHNKAVKLTVGKWAPYRTVATVVLWHSLGNAPQ